MRWARSREQAGPPLLFQRIYFDRKQYSSLRAFGPTALLSAAAWRRSNLMPVFRSGGRRNTHTQPLSTPVFILESTSPGAAAQALAIITCSNKPTHFAARPFTLDSGSRDLQHGSLVHLASRRVLLLGPVIENA